jgi:hypothetical protein
MRDETMFEDIKQRFEIVGRRVGELRSLLILSLRRCSGYKLIS